MLYYRGGYMEDWIWSAAKENNVSNIEIDILQKKVIPKSIEITPITAQLPLLEETINRELTVNGFSTGFFRSAKFEIYISDENKTKNIFHCIATLEDNDGKVYTSKRYTQLAPTIHLPAYKPSLIDKIKNLFSGKST